MKINKIMIFALVIFLSASLLTAAYTKKKAPVRRSASLVFLKGDKFLTPQIGLYSGEIPFGANFEYAITENIGVGATLMMWFGSGFSVIMPSVDAAYHFTMLKVEKLDLFAGAGDGFCHCRRSGVRGSSGLSLNPFIAGRYWFSDKIGGQPAGQYRPHRRLYWRRQCARRGLQDLTRQHSSQNFLIRFARRRAWVLLLFF